MAGLLARVPACLGPADHAGAHQAPLGACGPAPRASHTCARPGGVEGLFLPRAGPRVTPAGWCYCARASACTRGRVTRTCMSTCRGSETAPRPPACVRRPRRCSAPRLVSVARCAESRLMSSPSKRHRGIVREELFHAVHFSAALPGPRGASNAIAHLSRAHRFDLPCRARRSFACSGGCAYALCSAVLRTTTAQGFTHPTASPAPQSSQRSCRG